MLQLNLSRALMLSGAAAAFAVPALASAQAPDQSAEDTSSNSVGANEIIVTATRQAQTLQDTPMAVDVVTSEDVQKLNIFDAKEIQNLSPGLQLTNNDGRSNVATLRGVTFDPDSGSSPAVEIFLNEVPTDAQTVFTAIYDIGQIEVLRGPQGLFRGRTSPAGAILLGTQKADVNAFTGYVQATGSDQHALNAQGAANLALVPGMLGFRAALLYDENDVAGVRNVDGRRSRSQTMSGRASLAVESGPFKADLMYQHLRSELQPFVASFGPGNAPSLYVGDPSLSGPPLTLKDRKSVTEGPFRFDNNTDFVTLNAEYDLGGPTIAYNGGFQDTVLKQTRDQDVANAIPNYVRLQSLRTSYKIWNHELRVQSDPASPLIWSISGNYRNQKNLVPLTQSNDQFFALTGLGPLPAAISAFPVDVAVDIDIRSKEYGLAGTLGYRFDNGLTVMAGLRHTWSDVSRHQETTVFFPTGVDVEVAPGVVIPIFELPTTVDDSKLKKRAFTGGANASWEINPSVTVYAAYGHSYRPGVFAVGVTTPLDPSLLLSKDETSDGGEIGVKTTLFDRRASLNIAAFYQKFKNFLSYGPAFNTASARDGILDGVISPLPFNGDAISKGVEVQFSMRPTDNFDFGINASYADAHYTGPILCNTFDASGNPYVPLGQQVSTCDNKDRLAQIPKFNMNANAELRLPVGSVEPFIRGLVNYRPGFTSSRDNYKYRGYVKLDMFAGIRSANGRWEINVYAKNLLDQTRALSVSDGEVQVPTSELGFDFAPTGNAGIPYLSGYRTATISPPREFGITSVFRW